MRPDGLFARRAGLCVAKDLFSGLLRQEPLTVDRVQDDSSFATAPRWIHSRDGDPVP